MIYYVDINAAEHGNGSKDKPFARINDAAQVAVAGDEVLVAPGIYREYVILLQNINASISQDL